MESPNGRTLRRTKKMNPPYPSTPGLRRSSNDAQNVGTAEEAALANAQPRLKTSSALQFKYKDTKHDPIELPQLSDSSVPSSPEPLRNATSLIASTLACCEPANHEPDLPHAQDPDVDPDSRNTSSTCLTDLPRRLASKADEDARSSNEFHRSLRLLTLADPCNADSHYQHQKSRDANRSPSPMILNVAKLPDQESPLPATDPRKMLNLMRRTRGKMQGELLYRRNRAVPWSSSQSSIDNEAGCLRCDSEGPSDVHHVLIPNLRGCDVHAHFDAQSSVAVLHVIAADGHNNLELRPKNQSYFNAWFAALLCWQPLQQMQRMQTRIKKLHPVPLGKTVDEDDEDNILEANPAEKVSTIKAGNAILVELDEATVSSASESGTKSRKKVTNHWTRTHRTVISCILKNNGELILYAGAETLHVATVHLSQLPRSAVQRLNVSFLGADSAIAIYPQYAQYTDACTRLRPIYLTFGTRDLFEVWFVLCRAFTQSELYGNRRLQTSSLPSTSHVLPGIQLGEFPSLFRIERSLQIRICEARFYRDGDDPISKDQLDEATKDKHVLRFNYFAELLLDGQLKGNTISKSSEHNPAWLEDFVISEVVPDLAHLSFQVRNRIVPGLAQHSLTPIHDVTAGNARSETLLGVNGDSLIGEASIDFQVITAGEVIENRWLVKNEGGEEVGDIQVRIRYEQDIVLMEREYDKLNELLHHLPNAVTILIAERIPADLARLAECLLNVFQVSGHAPEWLMSLAEEEIDGVRESSNGRSRFTRRLESNESWDAPATSNAAGQREGIVRDLGKSATAEANLLFRGNTLLSKALDLHMRRLGVGYLDETIGKELRAIAVQDVDFEVDPDRISNSHDLQKNWKRLKTVTERLWVAIYESVEHCPVELRVIFKHIRACAEERYGHFMRSVTYSSVSGFLFLRFFCAAVLNPQLFNIVHGQPKPRAHRAYVLVAKGLQGLANMTTFGSKESWMEPMNEFLSSHRQQFKTFIEQICAVSPDDTVSMPPSYSAPLKLFPRLPLASREGFLSLPYLIDGPRALASLVNLWLDNRDKSENVDPTTPLSREKDDALLHFHNICVELRRRTQDCFEHAERAEKRTNHLAHKWFAIAERMEQAPGVFWVRNGREANMEPTKDSSNTPSRSRRRASEQALRRRAASSPSPQDPRLGSNESAFCVEGAVSPENRSGTVGSPFRVDIPKEKEKSKGSIFGRKKKAEVT